MNKLKNEVIIDCYKMKTANTGLYHFCFHLVNALQKKAANAKESISVFAPKNIRTTFPDNILQVNSHWWNSLRLNLPSHYKIWHETYQLGKFHPVSTKQKTVLTIHDLNFLYERNQKGLKTELQILQKNIDRSDKLIAISEFTKKDMLTHVDTHGKEIEVIHNGCSIYNGKLVQPDGEHAKRPFLYSLGTILPKKNFHVLPCLLKDNDYNLIITGKLSAYANQIMDEAKLWGVEKRVFLTGPIQEAEKQWYLKNCTAFLFPSIAEGFGLPVVEAMYYGKPVFLSSRTSLPEIGGSVATYFNDQFDPEGMREEFYNGMNRYKTIITPDEISKNAQRFSWDKAAEHYWNIYNSLR